jgi:hypothetical protein
MAMLISRATGNFTSSSTWGVADSATGSQLTNPTAMTATTASYVYSSTFTGTNTKVCDGVVLFVRRVNTLGTFTVALSDDNGVTATRSVTVDAADLPASESWVFFKFASTLTLDGGTDYRVGVVSSSAGSVNVCRDATAGNWGRLISTTDTAAPAAGDTMLVVGEWTGSGASTAYAVTMDNTATTDFGTSATSGTPAQTNPGTFSGIQIGQNGTLSWGTAATTNYYLKLSGNLVVWSGGTYNMGTVATPCPRDSTMYLQLDCAVNGDFGLVVMNLGVCNIQGQSRTSGKNITFCRLTANAAANATSLTVDTDTGWLDNDQIAVTSTTRTITQSEAGFLNGAAGASTLTVDGFAGTAGGVQFAHDGTAPFQAEVMLLTRNVRISGASASLNAYVLLNFVPTCDFDWAEFFWIGTGTAPRRGIEYGNSGPTSGDVNIQYCSIRNSGRCFFILGGGGGACVFSNNTCWNSTHGVNFAAASGLFTCNNNVVSLVTTDPCITAARNGTFENNIVSSSASSGFLFSGAGGQGAPTSFIGNEVHSCTGGGFNMGFSRNSSVSCDDLYAWRCGSSGITAPAAFADLTVTNSTITGCVFGLAFGNPSNGAQVVMNNVGMSTEASYAMTNGITYATTAGSESSGLSVSLTNCTINSSTADISVGQGRNCFIALQNCLLSGPSEVANQSSLLTTSNIKSSKHDQTEGAFRSWFGTGRIDRDTTIFNNAAPSERLTPISSTLKFQSAPRLVAVDDGTTVTVNVYVRKSVVGDGAAYNGGEPRLIVKANPACGIATDTVLDTMTASAGSWEQLTGTTATVDADGALEFVVDCNGTTGWINVDDWSVS